jgi:branched-chain amino acid transport system permease protein
MQWLNIIVQGVLLGSLYAVYGAGLSLTFGVMRTVNLAYGDFIVVAAYLSLACGQLFGLSPFASLLVVVPVFFSFGYLLQRGVLNRVLGKGLMPPLLITFGIAVILQNLLLLIFSADSRALEAGRIETQSIQLGGIAVGVLPLLNLVVAVAMLGALQLFLSRSALGRAFRATSDDPDVAELMGISSRRIYGIALGISLVVVAVAGVLLGIRTSFAPSDGPTRLIYAFEAVIIGGLGSLWGTLFGGMILGVAQTVGAQIGPIWFQLAGHLVTIAVLVFRPTGLFARTREADG